MTMEHHKRKGDREDHIHERRQDKGIAQYKWILPIILPLISAFGTYKVLQYRVDETEQKVKELTTEKEKATERYFSLEKDKELIKQSLNEVVSSIRRIESDVREVKVKQDEMANKLINKVAETK